NSVALYRNESNTTWHRTVMPGSADASTVAVADLDGDGNMDILAAGQDDNSVFWYRHTGANDYTQYTLATNLQSVYGVATGDLTNDGNLDIVAGDLFRGSLFWYER